eukprot:403376928
MGNSESQQYNPEDYAYRVVAVLQDSPAQHVGIEAQLDFIMYNPQQHDGKLFSEYLSENEGKELKLWIYNVIQQDNRMVQVTLNKNWGDKNSLLGATIRYESFIDAHNHILKVNDVYLDSPAHEAGMQPFQDFILGTREIAFKNLDEFAKYIEVNKGQEIRLHIYNVEKESLREVPLIPREWNGNGLLGCDVSFGYFNKIPLRKIDQERITKKYGLAGIFGKLTGDIQTEISSSDKKQIIRDPQNQLKQNQIQQQLDQSQNARHEEKSANAIPNTKTEDGVIKSERNVEETQVISGNQISSHETHEFNQDTQSYLINQEANTLKDSNLQSSTGNSPKKSQITEQNDQSIPSQNESLTHADLLNVTDKDSSINQHDIINDITQKQNQNDLSQDHSNFDNQTLTQVKIDSNIKEIKDEITAHTENPSKFKTSSDSLNIHPVEELQQNSNNHKKERKFNLLPTSLDFD